MVHDARLLYSAYLSKNFTLASYLNTYSVSVLPAYASTNHCTHTDLQFRTYSGIFKKAQSKHYYKDAYNLKIVILYYEFIMSLFSVFHND